MKRISIFIIAVSLVSAVYSDVIYDDQTYDLGATWDAYRPSSGLADDFEITGDYLLTSIRLWVTDSPPWDIEVEIRNDSDGSPGWTLYADTIPFSEVYWLDTGDDFGGYSVFQVDVPIQVFEIEGGTIYWLCIHDAPSQFRWLVMPNQPEWWENCHVYDFDGFGWYWYDSLYYYGKASACEFELHGIPPDDVNPEITEPFPHDSDFPSGVPVDTNVTFRVTDDVSGCDTDETTCTVEESGSPVLGDLTYDDSDPLDVAFTWEPDEYYVESTTIDVTVETYDLAGNGPITESWSFTTGYVNVAPASLGAIKAGFVE